jgi:CubicO group peptidase (beta-lactamase class C family)
VLIARNGQLLYNKSFGATPTGKPNDANVAFSLASMSKLFTTVSILQLVDAHKISLDDSVAKLLPQLKNKALYPITVRQLLTHTSGMGDYFEDPLFDPFKGRKFTRQDALPAVEKDKLHFPPGTSFGYSNTGFELLGLIVEKVSATPLESYIRQHVFEKVGMNHSTFGVASGGSEATIGDMYNFSQTLLSNKLLTPATTAYFFNYHTTDWGLGEEYQQLGSEVITGHSGGFEGVCTELNMYKNSGYTVIILSNTNPPYGHFLSDRIKETIIRK